jgi:hypothetical protein
MDREFTTNPFVTDATPSARPAVIIAGSRAFDDAFSPEGLATLVESVLEEAGVAPAEVVSGGADGVDAAGERVAHRRGIPVAADGSGDNPFDVPSRLWRDLGGVAGPMRNEAMAVYADQLVALWDGESSGTTSMIRLARRHLGDDNVHVREIEL